MIINFDLVKSLADALPEDYVFMEVGTAEGDNAIRILETIKNSKNPKRTFICVDPYGDLPYNIGGKVFMMGYDDSMWKRTYKRLSEYAETYGLNFALNKMTSFQYIDLLKKSVETAEDNQQLGHRLGFVYLDGQHSSEIVTKEVEFFLTRLSSNGKILIDDYNLLIDIVDKDGKVEYVEPEKLKQIIEANPDKVLKNPLH